MDITTEQTERDSVKEFSDRLCVLLDAGAGLIHVRAHEPLRAAVEIRKVAIAEGAAIKEWDVVNGFRDFSETNIGSHTLAGDGNIDPHGAFMHPLTYLRSPENTNAQFYVFYTLHHYLEGNPQLQHLITTYNQILPSSNVVVVIVTPDIPLPVQGENVLSITFDTPSLNELRESLTAVVDGIRDEFGGGVDMDDDAYNRVCYVGAGMTKNDFEIYSALSLVRAGRDGLPCVTADEVIKGVSEGKTDVVNQSEILELYPSTSIENVGGLENLKEWVARRRRCYWGEAGEFGVEPPKGIVLVGPPGTGKSLVAKAVSSELGVPLVRLDFGRVFNSLVGSSEQRMRQALRQVESMAPVVLFADEIDKGLGGIGSGGDSGVSSRVLGSFLTWLQDCKHPVFTMVTANNVTGLPPELLRRGRFDAIFSTSLPNATERREVLRIHLSLRGRSIEDFNKAEIEEYLKATEGYVPAEIESSVKDALVDAFSAGEDLTMDHMLVAVRAMVPLSKAFEKRIKEMNEWAINNATPAGKKQEPAPATSLGARVIKRTRRT